MNRAKIYQDMNDTELKDALKSKKQELFNLRFQHTIGQLKNPKQLVIVKRDIARILTEQKRRGAK
ncbi:MAG: 50S ribosomal protein L29 [Christensenellaceae bacterium]|jgi:large subunit ribosomal protein L29|nr:50S ribosomal protein L29 [Christensenellaceae bacterium]